ncbi:bifunctional glutathionylspermidine amidase/glutathionylspermidine synthetase [Thraustotheca clavata]|uniref:Bifunctional glutathionylspermidine amidase/glutathionylspermidine synthetase n=1 Tax=Thraustotheca clavata TaxID=74557 RepID=A0A0A7CMP2_9STRA|nr:secreted protein [Thraustotheca clavata]OQR81940.1 bifunctional glutathionylspermidine amidase/glutathionylspermidine synthetase [Thraustotheca clavata]
MLSKAIILCLVCLNIAITVNSEPAPFGTVIGVTNGPTNVYSCNNPPQDDPNYYPEGTDDSNGTYTGIKWQCVELARRYLFINYNLLFDSVDGASDIYNLTTITNAKDNSKVAFKAHAQGSSIPLVIGSLVIYDKVGKYAPWGHVAVVVNVTSDHIDIVEQNVEDTYWKESYSRRLNVTRTASSFTINKYYPEVEIVLGWMTADIHPQC